MAVSGIKYSKLWFSMLFIFILYLTFAIFTFFFKRNLCLASKIVILIFIMSLLTSFFFLSKQMLHSLKDIRDNSPFDTLAVSFPIIAVFVFTFLKVYSFSLQQHWYNQECVQVRKNISETWKRKKNEKKMYGAVLVLNVNLSRYLIPFSFKLVWMWKARSFID